MNLEYNILWVDDNIEGLESLFDTHIKGQIESLGFLMKLDFANNEDELKNILSKKNNFNLIFMDYCFDDENKGVNLIEEIRAKDIYSNIIFYSAQDIEELKKAIKDNNINGTYAFYRQNILRDLEKIKKMIKFDILNNLDESAMRGITMAEVAEIDHILLDIVKMLPDENKWEIIEHNSKNVRHQHCKKLIEKLDNNDQKEKYISKCQEILSIKDADLKKSILEDPDKSSRVFPTSARTEFLYGNETFNKIIGEHNIEQLRLFKKYKTDVIEPRNKLAHYKNPGNINYTELRKNIIKHKNNIIKIAEEIKKIEHSEVADIS